MELPEVQLPQEPKRQPRGFHVESQAITLELDLRRQLLIGSTEIKIQPHTSTLDSFRLHCRQVRIKDVTVEGKLASWTYRDPYISAAPHHSFSIRQHHIIKAKVEDHLSSEQEEELVVTRPRIVDIKESEEYKAIKQEALDVTSPTQVQGDSTDQFVPLTIKIDFETDGARDGLQWIGCRAGDERWPHVYTRTSTSYGTASSLFPCLDDPSSRHPWTIFLNCPRTLGGAFPKVHTIEPSAGTTVSTFTDGVTKDVLPSTPSSGDELDLSKEERELELSAICSGEFVGEVSICRQTAFMISTDLTRPPAPTIRPAKSAPSPYPPPLVQASLASLLDHSKTSISQSSESSMTMKDLVKLPSEFMAIACQEEPRR